MALNGRDGQRFSQAPQPMHRSVFTAGTIGDSSSSGLKGTIAMAPTGQWRAQLPHSTPSVTGTQFFFTHTAWPICIDDFSATSIGLMAPAGHTVLQRVHSGRQYPCSYDMVGCMNVDKSVDARSTPLGHSDTQSWHAVQCCCMLRADTDPGGVSGVVRFIAFLSSITARPPSTFFFC